jgi:hypothetical protein
LFWTGALVALLPPESALRLPLDRAWRYAYLPLAGVLLVVAAPTEPLSHPASHPLNLAVLLAVLLPLLAAALLVLRQARTIAPRRPLVLSLLATLLFGLGTGALFLPGVWLPRSWVVLGIGADLALLGVTAGALDAFDQGEAWLPDFLRSLIASLFFALLFAGPLALWLFFGSGGNLGLLGLLLAALAAAFLTQVFTDPLQTLLDRLALAASPDVRHRRVALRSEARALTRTDPDLDPHALPAKEFARLTRRALSHYGDLPRLASSPLTRLGVVEARLAGRNAGGHTLARAAELKTLLTEAIQQLKPPGPEGFGTTDEWRHYNALYFPYVCGLRPYQRRVEYTGLEGKEQEALTWFRSQVPERTLYNWQNAAAGLVAQYLRELAET